MTVDPHLSPADAAVAVRSFPRRFRAALARPDDDDDRWEPDEIGRRIGSDGTSAADRLLAADGVLSLTERGLADIVGPDPGPLHPAFADLAGATWDDPHTPVPALLDQFEATAASTAARIDALAAEQWAARASVAGQDATIAALDVVRAAVGAVADHLRAAERIVREVR